uniref:SFRICE_031998 n=1 Tax=Spodoptera frugiperda TaxID=7108 RepID=A0A2H1VSL8_SPOFR
MCTSTTFRIKRHDDDDITLMFSTQVHMSTYTVDPNDAKTSSTNKPTVGLSSGIFQSRLELGEREFPTKKLPRSYSCFLSRSHPELRKCCSVQELNPLHFAQQLAGSYSATIPIVQERGGPRAEEQEAASEPPRLKLAGEAGQQAEAAVVSESRLRRLARVGPPEARSAGAMTETLPAACLLINMVSGQVFDS